jgi:hypothetical protein
VQHLDKQLTNQTIGCNTVLCCKLHVLQRAMQALHERTTATSIKVKDVKSLKTDKNNFKAPPGRLLTFAKRMSGCTNLSQLNTSNQINPQSAHRLKSGHHFLLLHILGSFGLFEANLPERDRCHQQSCAMPAGTE